MLMGRTTTIGSILLLIAGLATAVFAAEALPPIGKRVYVLDGNGKKGAPVAIERDTSKAAASVRPGRFLKDPIQPAKGVKAPPPLPVPPPRPKAPVRTARSAQLRFKPLNVNGHLKQPRVEFTRDELPLDRADEPLSSDFYNKVFEPAQDDGF